MANIPDRGPPSAAAIAIGTALISAVTGYYLGQARSIGVFGRAVHSDPLSDVEDHEGSDISGDDDPTNLLTFPGNTEECKLVLVVRTDLGMTKGKPPKAHVSYPIPNRERKIFWCSQASLRHP